MIPMPERQRALLFLNGLGLWCLAVFVGWQWFISLLGQLVLWPLIPPLEIQLPNDPRAWRMAHMEALTQGFMVMAVGFGGAYVYLSERAHRVLFWCAVITGWLFAIPSYFHALFGTRGLAFGGGPFKSGFLNDVLYLFGWPPMIAVHVMLLLAILGVWRYLRTNL